jgi:hypothetical protein
MFFDWVNGGDADVDDVVTVVKLLSSNKGEQRSINNILEVVFNYSYKPTSSAAQFDVNAVVDGDSVKSSIALQFITNSGGIFFGTVILPDERSVVSGGFIME